MQCAGPLMGSEHGAACLLQDPCPVCHAWPWQAPCMLHGLPQSMAQRAREQSLAARRRDTSRGRLGTGAEPGLCFTGGLGHCWVASSDVRLTAGLSCLQWLAVHQPQYGRRGLHILHHLWCVLHPALGLACVAPVRPASTGGHCPAQSCRAQQTAECPCACEPLRSCKQS